MDVRSQVLSVKKTIEEEISLKLPMVLDNGFGAVTVEVSVHDGHISHVIVTSKETKKMARSG